MKQAIYYAPKDVKVLESPIPEIGDNDILVKNLIGSICGSDVFAYYHSGDFEGINPGDEFGHEMVSEVVKVGKNVTDVTVGQRLYPFPILAKGNYLRAGTVGGYSEYITLPNFKLGMSAFAVDDCISDESASLIEPLTVGYHAAKLALPSEEKNAIVFGAGMIGLASALALRDLGVKNIIISDISELRLNIAKEFGFKVCNVATDDLSSYARAEFGEAMGKINADCLIDAAGVKSNLEFYLNNGKSNSIFVIAAVYHEPVAINWMQVTFGQLHLVGSPAYDFTDVFSVLEMLKKGNNEVEKLITHKYPLDEIVPAFEMAANAKESLKVVIDHRK